jgi:hypothetical protein
MLALNYNLCESYEEREVDEKNQFKQSISNNYKLKMNEEVECLKEKFIMATRLEHHGPSYIQEKQMVNNEMLLRREQIKEENIIELLETSNEAINSTSDIRQLDFSSIKQENLSSCSLSSSSSSYYETALCANVSTIEASYMADSHISNGQGIF